MVMANNKGLSADSNCLLEDPMIVNQYDVHDKALPWDQSQILIF